VYCTTLLSAPHNGHTRFARDAAAFCAVLAFSATGLLQ
jgi:hypothetical protein